MRLFKRFDGIRADAAAALVLVVLVIAAFGITATFGFVYYDDQEVVFNNPFVSAGLTWTGLRWAWGLESRPDTPDWFNWPLTWMTHQADCQAYGLWAGGHHVQHHAARGRHGCDFRLLANASVFFGNGIRNGCHLRH